MGKKEVNFMKTSIAMTTYNGDKYLADQLNSFLKQTVLPDELVACDDNSNDDTIDILTEFKKIAPFDVKIFQNSMNLGFVKNFENAISKTTGDIIFLSDQDDVWFPEKIEEHLNYYAENSTLRLIINDQEIVDEELNPSGITRLGNLKKMGLPFSYFNTGCCTSFHKSLNDLILPIPHKYINHDEWIHKVGGCLNRRFVDTTTLQYYRRHEHTVTVGYMKNRIGFNIINFYLDVLRSPAKNYFEESKILIELKNRISNHLFWAKKDILLEINNEIIRNLKRAKIANDNFIKKKCRSISMLISGDYRHFNGYKSFIKDFLS